MIEDTDIIAIGKFQKTHALKGELNAVIDIDEDFFENNRCIVVEMEGIFTPFILEGIRRKGNFAFLIKLEDVDSEEAARRFVNKEINVPLPEYKAFEHEFSEDPEEDEDGFYSSDFIGFEIVLSNGTPLGVVKSLDLTTQNALFEVVRPDNDMILIPVADEYIVDIDQENKKLVMDLPEGLLDIN